MLFVKGVVACLLLWALLILGLGLGCARLPPSGTVPAEQVAEP